MTRHFRRRPIANPAASLRAGGTDPSRGPIAQRTRDHASTYMGHANISITLDRYGHLMPGNEAQAAKLLDAYLDVATV